MICFPNAKINLGLHITDERPDGYHTIETVFYPVPFKDALEAVPSERLTFAQTGISIQTAAPDDNLVMKAYRFMSQICPLPPLEIYLYKAIPAGAGLGGGSADAAFMLQLLNKLCDCRLSNDRLEELAASLGADCPFFIRNTPVLATGTGTVFKPIDLSLKGYAICIAKPEIAVSTREAYSGVKPKRPSFALNELPSIPVGEWKNTLVNDFEPSIFEKYPEIKAIKERLYALGAEYAAMSGSGSAVFGLYRPDIFQKDVFIKSFPDCFVWTGTLN